MPTLITANVESGSATTNLKITGGNTAAAALVLYSNNSGLEVLNSTAGVLLSINASSNVLLNGVPLGGTSTTRTNLTVSGVVIFSGNVTPAALTSNASAWNPDSTDIAYTIRVSANSASNTANAAYGQIYEPAIFGFSAGTNGQIYTISNIGPQKIQIRNEDTATETTAANRFDLPNHIWLYGYQSVQVIYDGTLARWVLLNGVGARPMGSLGYDYDNTITFRTTHKSLLDKGFFCSGGVSATNKTTYSTETTAAAPTANLADTRAGVTSAGNSEKGFICGSTTNVSDKITFSTETRASSPTTILTAVGSPGNRGGASGSGNSDKGFFCGGANLTFSVFPTADRVRYATETVAAVSGANLVQARDGLASFCNSDKGFYIGGNTRAPGTVSTAERTVYSTETLASVSGANLTQVKDAVFGGGGFGNPDKGFTTGTNGPALGGAADRTTYSTETTAAVTGANLVQARSYCCRAGNADKGFISGGFTPATPLSTTAERTNYFSETNASVSGANLINGRSQGAGL